MSRTNTYRVVLSIWASIWMAGFTGLCVYLYNGGHISILVWLGFLLLGVLNPGIEVFKEIFGTQQSSRSDTNKAGRP